MKTIIKNILLITKIIFCAVILVLDISVCHAQKKPAVLNLTFSEKDGKKLITAKAYEVAGDSTGAPIPDLDLFFYVDRSFSPLPIGDVFNTTDEAGKATIEFPEDLPGDTLGNVKIIAKIKDSDDYADTEVSKVVQWGVPMIIDHSENKRTLWAASANAPISLLLLVNGLIVAAWGIILFIFYKIYLISKM